MSTTALITGGTSGIGRAVANKLAQLGIHVVVVGRNEERGERTVAEIAIIETTDVDAIADIALASAFGRCWRRWLAAQRPMPLFVTRPLPVC
jgi:short-subunit dehydrogenase involved in D-alanine esterification of teichoic acids